MNSSENRILYFRWLRAAQPQAYEAAMRSFRSDSGLGIDWGSILDTATKAASVVIQTRQRSKELSLQKKQVQLDAETRKQEMLLTVNTQRAQVGLPPVDINGNVIAGATLPAASAMLQQAGAAVGVPANSAAFVSGNTMYYILGGVGLLAIFLFMKR